MLRWRRSRVPGLLGGAALTALLCSLFSAAAPALAATAGQPSGPSAVAVVNGERIGEDAVQRALREEGRGLPREKVVDALIEEALVEQEARRLKVGESDRFRVEFQRWREAEAEYLLRVEDFRRHLERKGRKTGSFADFQRRWPEGREALSAAEREAADQAAGERVANLRSGARAVLRTVELKKFTLLKSVPPATAREVLAARTDWADITLEDILEEEKRSKIHSSVTPDEVIRLWQQFATAISERRLLLRTAEKEGLFGAPGVREQEERARRAVLRSGYLEGVFAREVTPEATIRRAGLDLPKLSAAHGLTAEIVRVPKATRSDVEVLLPDWREGKVKAGLSRETLPLDRAWAGFSAEQRQVLVDQPWDSYAPPLRSGDGYVLVRLAAKAPPPGGATLRRIAETELRTEIYRSLVEKLRAKARITRP